MTALAVPSAENGARPRLAAIGSRFTRADFLLIGAAVLCVANTVGRRSDGQAYVVGIQVTIIATLIVVAALRAPIGPLHRWVAAGAGFTMAVSVMALYDLNVPASLGLPIAVAAGASVAVRNRRLAWVLGSVAVLGAAGFLATRWSDAFIDVFTDMQAAAAALLHGHDPYALQLPIAHLNPDGSWTTHYGPFDYEPGVILVTLPARLLGDVRIAGACAALLIVLPLARWVGWRRWEFRALAVAYLVSPFVGYVVVLGWNDVYAIAGMALWLMLRERRRRWSTIALLIGLAAKVTIAPILLPLFLRSRTARLEILAGVAGGLLLLVPFAIWDGPSHFIQAIAGVYFDPQVIGVRADSLSIPGLVARSGSFVPLWLTALIAAALGFAIVMRDRRVDTGTLLTLGAALMLLGLLAAKVAFINYYEVAFVAILLAVAADIRKAETIAVPVLAAGVSDTGTSSPMYEDAQAVAAARS